MNQKGGRISLMGSIIDKGINRVEGVGGEETVVGEEDDGEMRLKNIQWLMMR